MGAQLSDLAVLQGRDSGRVDSDTERQGERILAAHIDVVTLLRCRVVQVYRCMQFFQQPALGALPGYGVEKRLVLTDVFHQPGKVSTHILALLFQHALHAPIADASQQQRECE